MEQLVKKAKNRNKEAFEDLMQIQAQSMYKVAKAILKNDEDVLDAMQETALTCWEKIGTLKQERYFKTWLIRILINHCTDVVRQQKRVVSMEQAEEQTGTFLESDYEFYELIRELPEKDRTIFLLYYGECFNVREIAELLGWNENTVKSRLQRGRKKLEQVLSC